LNKLIKYIYIFDCSGYGGAILIFYTQSINQYPPLLPPA
jgi:hypothetical protein